ncbi:hypothetical protein MHUMG1_07392 [Metarhizium humberi]|uniref:Peptidase S8/S53 domain-containing protein n=1 Tax=Metarhizium humberi TaxID=2596975 RepID=A0A9P8M7S4_9HYPO|nr:hypothetical protein MHUMG1_07392 [Metarhizium humberi]
MHISITLALFFGLTSARVAHAPVVESQIDQPESVINDNTLAPLELALGLKNHVKLAKRSLQTQTSAPWGLRAISHRSPGDFYEEFPPPESSKYYYDDKAGAGTFAYILDSGIRTTHEEFEGRAKAAHSIYPADQTIHGDHGTGVAGIIGPNGCTGSEAINALLWAAEDILKNSRKDSLIIETDVPIVVAAGNEADDASNHSPGSADGVISVGHINQQWAISETSNFGSAVSILAPGVGVETTGAGSDTNIIRETGSSFATPYISGLILNAISIHGIKGAANLKKHILETATKDKACIPPEKEDKKNRTPNLVGNNNNAEQDKEKQKDEPSSSRMFCCNGLLSKLACGRNRPMNE